ncbi:LysE family translocator [bacterium]|nr:LysE family translocator [bacterium]
MRTEITILLSGIVLGLSAGISPGPILTLAISQTLQHGLKEGIKIAFVPVITDLPIIAITLGLLSRLSEVHTILGIIALLGSLFLIYLGYECVTIKPVDPDRKEIKPQSLRKGILANFLNPNPYLFWLSVGTPIILKAHQINLLSPTLFIITFYICLVGSKCIVVFLTERSRHLLKSKYYVIINKLLGIVLWIFALLFIKEGLGHFGLITL